MKKRLAIAGVIAAVLALCALGTLAYFTAEGRATNVITTGTVELTLHEMQQGADGQLAEYPDEPITGVMPGQSGSKIPYVENSGSQPFSTDSLASCSHCSSVGSIPVGLWQQPWNSTTSPAWASLRLASKPSKSSAWFAAS